MYEMAPANLTAPIKSQSGKSLRFFLSRARARVPFEDFLKIVCYVDVEARIPRPPNFEDVPDLPDRVRGAWGRALERQLKAGLEVAADPLFAPAWEIFFGDYGGALNKCGRPYLIETDAKKSEILIRLRLVGLARQWWQEAGEGLRDALATGIAIHQHGAFRVPIKNVDIQFHRRRGVGSSFADETADGLDLYFVTPLAIRRRGVRSVTLADFALGIYERAKSVAHWQGLSLSLPQMRLRDAFSELEVVRSNLQWQHWDRYSSTTGHKPMPVWGSVGHYRLHGRNAGIVPLLQLGKLVHVGSNTAIGFGRIDFASY